MSITPEQPTDKPEPTLEVEMAAEKLTAILGNPAAGDMIRDLVAGTVNRTIGAMAPTFSKVFATQLGDTLRAELSGVKKQIDANGNTTAAVAQAVAMIDERLTRKDRIDLDWRTQWRTEDDARRDAVHIELDEILKEMGGLKQQNTQLQEGFSSFAESVDELRLEVGAMRTEQQSMREDVATLKTNDMAKFEWLERLEAGLGKANDGAKHTNARIDQLVDVQLRFAERQRSLEENAAVGVMSGEQRASMMRWFMENIDKLQALIDAGAPQSKQANG